MWNTYTHNITYNTYPTVVLYEMWLPVILRMISFLETPIVQISWPHSIYSPTGKLYNYPFTSGRGQSMRWTKGWSDPELLQLSYDHGGSSAGSISPVPCWLSHRDLVHQFTHRSSDARNPTRCGFQFGEKKKHHPGGPGPWAGVHPEAPHDDEKEGQEATGRLGHLASQGRHQGHVGHETHGSGHQDHGIPQPQLEERVPDLRAAGQCGFAGGRYEETIIYNSIVFPNLKGVLACPLAF